MQLYIERCMGGWVRISELLPNTTKVSQMIGSVADVLSKMVAIGLLKSNIVGGGKTAIRQIVEIVGWCCRTAPSQRKEHCRFKT